MAEGKKKEVRFQRKAYAGLPSVLRIKILQILCFERVGTAPGERLLSSMDRLIVSGGPSARLSVGRGSTLRCRYGEAILSPPGPEGKKELAAGRSVPTRKPVVQMDGPGTYRWGRKGRKKGGSGTDPAGFFLWEERGKTAPGRIRRWAKGENRATFDGDRLSRPLSIRPLRAGDRIRPFGADGNKKVKEILIDRKVPREERWGRPVVCDSQGAILWIPGVLRSGHAPVTPQTKRTIVLQTDIAKRASP